jgi:hypothetical protein
MHSFFLPGESGVDLLTLKVCVGEGVSLARVRGKINPLPPLSDLLNDVLRDATPKANSCTCIPTNPARADIPPIK